MRDRSNRTPSLSNRARWPLLLSLPISEVFPPQNKLSTNLKSFVFQGLSECHRTEPWWVHQFFFLERSPCLAIVTKGILLLVMATS